MNSSVDRVHNASERRVWMTLASVEDPEIPVLSVVDLGIVRFVRWDDDERLHVGITPTYSGCPATQVIRQAVEAALHRAGYPDALIEEVIAPAWTTDWISAEGRRKLREFGIAPPTDRISAPVACPRCGSHASEKVSEFGSTPCKAHYRCRACLEPFDCFKCL